MKTKILFVLLMLIAGFCVSAQEPAHYEYFNEYKRNEVKVDVAHLLFATLKVEYEYLLNDWSGAGAAALYNFTKDSPFSEIRSQLVGFYRLYFGKQPVSGFFLEGNMGLISYEGYNYNYQYNNYNISTSFGVGIALGRKWHNERSNIVLDIFVGLGRTFNKEHEIVYPRLGICVGKRF
jgi:hypothetical protein